MLARSGPLPTNGEWAFEVKWDGSELVPELAELPMRGVFDGELVGFRDDRPHFDATRERLLFKRRKVPIVYVIFDVLALEGESTHQMPYRERRALLNVLPATGPWWLVRAGALQGRSGPL
jgi:bifunctional non-homologous end joining protein LigD